MSRRFLMMEKKKKTSSNNPGEEKKGGRKKKTAPRSPLFLADLERQGDEGRGRLPGLQVVAFEGGAGAAGG